MVETWSARAVSRATELGLRLRSPARRACGSVRNAVFAGAIIVGAYLLLIASMYLDRPWGYRGMSTLVSTGGGFSIISAITNIALIFGILIKKDNILQYILCGTMAVYLICAPLSLFLIIGVAVGGFYDIPLWEMPRLGACLLHLGLMFCLLAELRGDPEPPCVPQPPPAEGWLKNNMLRHKQSPPSTGDDTLLKVQVDTPAVISPSSCTTAAPVHSNPAANSTSSNA